jgi:tyrosine-protein phosphatase 2/3
MPYSVGQPYPPKLSPARLTDARAPSPNYFGLVVETPNDPRDSSNMPRENWSPPTSSVKSFAAALPKHMPLDGNPDFEAFRRQADINRGTSFSLPTSQFPPSTSQATAGHMPNPTANLRPRPPRWHAHGSDTVSEYSLGRSTSSKKERPLSRTDVDQDSLHDSAYVSSDSKRNSEVSLNPPASMNFNLPRFESPRQAESPFERRTTLSRNDDRHPRLSIVHNKADPPSPEPARLLRAETDPPNLESGPSLLTPAGLQDIIEELPLSEYLLLDLRVSQQYAQSRIRGALNLCIPTTLLKRATYNLQKLQQTFSSPEDEERFSRWRETQCLIVYDAFSSEKRDAVSAMNMIKKFTNESYKGKTYILRGGFNGFRDELPELVDDQIEACSGGAFLNTSGSGGRPGVAPVIGGVMLPTTTNNSNAFFSNIRQNMDLADGVGQMDIARPSGLESPTLPQWLRKAVAMVDHGKQISNKFLHIERDEQSRMKSAYNSFNTNVNDSTAAVQLCGIEMGGKNRYKDILPFEHARVKLLDRTNSTDYVNASHIKASRSNKRYIATQGPLPATFEVR